MKKVLMILLTLAMVFSMAGVVSAEGEKGTDVTYQAAEHCVISVPSKVAFSTIPGTAEHNIGVSEVNIPEGGILTLTVESENDYTLVNGTNKDSKIPYTVTRKNDGSVVSATGNVFSIDAGKTEHEEAFTFTAPSAAYVKYSGEHKDRLTFTTETVYVPTTGDEQLKDDLTADEKNIVITLGSDVTYDIAAWATNGMGGASTETITINGNGKTITFKSTDSDWDNIVTSNNAKLIIKDAKIVKEQHSGSNGAWNSYGLNINCPVELTNVELGSTIVLRNDAVLTNVVVTESKDYYAIMVTATGQTVSLNDVTVDSQGRGVKIIDQYVTSPSKVTLNIKDSIFDTQKKAAILVTSSAGADITLENVNIKDVSADSVNTVWIDEVRPTEYDLVTVTGGTKSMEPSETNTIYIGSADAMFAFANDVNKNGKNYAGKTVKLVEDIDLENKDWEPIGQAGSTEFKGVFDGQEKTISNLYIDSSDETGPNYSSGLFGWIESNGAVTVKNVTVSGATVIGHHNVAVIVGYLYGTVENCHVTGATITCTHANDDACGDKAGVIVGYAGPAADNVKIAKSSAKYCTVSAGRDAGQLIGLGYTASISELTANNVQVSATGDCTGANVNNNIIGRVMA